MIHPEITVALTLDDIKLYDRAREIGLPSIVVSMYGDRIKKLLVEEQSTEREACAKLAENRCLLGAGKKESSAYQFACKAIAEGIRARGQA